MESEAPFDQYIEPGEPVGFTRFMLAYPNPTNREEARIQWRRLNAESDLQAQAEIMRCLRLQKETGAWTETFWPNAGTYLQKRRWKDALVNREKPSQPPAPAAAAPTRVERSGQARLAVTSNLSPEEAQAALRAGFVEGWKAAHPGEPVPDGDPLKAALASNGFARYSVNGKSTDPAALQRAIDEAREEYEGVRHR